jgi:hypothetical protein
MCLYRHCKASTEREGVFTDAFQALLCHDVLPWISSKNPDSNTVFQQDSTLAHAAISLAGQ